MRLAFLLYTLFTIMSVAGAYLIGVAHGTRRQAIAWAVGTLVFFIALVVAIVYMVEAFGGGEL